MSTDDEAPTHPAAPETTRNGTSIRISTATAETIERIRVLLAARAAPGGSLEYRVPPGDIVGMTVRAWLERELQPSAVEAPSAVAKGKAKR
jgi:hypothetical protein